MQKNHAIKEDDFDVAGRWQADITDKEHLSITFLIRKLAKGKDQNDRNSLFWWEAKSPFRENKAGVGAEKGNPTDTVLRLIRMARSSPYTNNNNIIT